MREIIDHKFVEFPFADYLLVFISIIVGYVVTEFFAGWGGLIRNRENVKIYWLHLLWTFNFFFQLIENWWWLWGNRLKLAEHIYYFAFSLASPLVFYLITVFLFPSIKEDQKTDFKNYYFKNTPYIFTLFAILMCVYFVNNIWIKQQATFGIDNLFCISGFAFSFLYIFIKKEWFHVTGYIVGASIFFGYVMINSTK
ncbi:MAG: hypothetical protein ACKVOU_01015 [Cytophagales bacterium]